MKIEKRAESDEQSESNADIKRESDKTWNLEQEKTPIKKRSMQ